MSAQVIGNSGYELSWFFNPFYPSYWEKIAVEHGYMRCEVRVPTILLQHRSPIPLHLAWGSCTCSV